MSVLVTGGAGYIGSHTLKELTDRGEKVLVVDNLERGHRQAVGGAAFIEGDLTDAPFLEHLFSNHTIESVIHFAAHSQVGESVQDPLRYYRNNVVGTLTLLDAMVRWGVGRMVFSSTAAVYGEPQNTPIDEEDPLLPQNPYGETKRVIEEALHWMNHAHGLRSISLRYFNAAGAHLSGQIGEDHRPETHLIPIVLDVALGKRPHLTVFGRDYNTGDGTCIRDYVHVSDLAQAHLLALDQLRQGHPGTSYNLGNGQGFSVLEVVETARNVTGKDIPIQWGERRPGDPAVLVAASEKARTKLGWSPQHSDLKTILETAWQWHRNNPEGFTAP